MADSIKASIFIQRPILSSVISIIITLAGLVALNVLPVAQYPELAPPTVHVQATYPGASASTVSETVLSPLEVQVNGVEGMLYMTSTAASSSGTGALDVYFAIGTNPDMALVNVCNKVNLAQTSLPETVRSLGVTVVKRSPSMLMVLSLTSPNKTHDMVYLHNFLKISIADELKRIQGVGSVDIFSTLDYSMRIWLHPDKMAKYSVTVSDIVNCISDQNSQFAPGSLGATPSPQGTLLTWQIDTQGRLQDVKSFENIIIKTGESSSHILLKDLARVELGGQEYGVDSDFNNRPSPMAGIYLLPGANALHTGELIRKRIEELKISFPEDVELTIAVNTNNFVRASIKEVIHTLIEAMVLVFLVVFIFLQNWRATIIPCVSVPVSIIGTFAGMFALGYTINTLTLFGLVLAIGIVVDDAIVVLENVERIMSTEHLSSKDATAKAMHEVTSALIAIVLVLCSVFIPVSFMGGLAGEMYKQFAITISISVVLSGIEALTLTPALCAILLKNHEPSDKTFILFKKFNIFFDSCTKGYVGTVRFVKDHGLISFTIFCSMVAGLVFLAKVVPTQMVPDEDQGYVLGSILLDDGASHHRVREIGQMYSDFAAKDKSVKNTVVINGYDILSSSTKTNCASFFAEFKDWGERKKEGMKDTDFIQRVKSLTMQQPSALFLGFIPPAIPGMGTAGGFEAFVQMRTGESLESLEEKTNKFVRAAQQRPEIAGNAQNLFTTGAPQLYARLDRERCKDMGIDVQAVFATMQGMFGSYYVNDFTYMSRTFQVRLQGDMEYRLDADNLSDTYVKNSKGEMVPLSSIITLERRTAPQIVDRYNVFPAARVMGGPAPGYTAGQAMQALEEVAKETLPTGYTLGWAGASLQTKIASSDSSMIFVLALVMVFLILAAQYESWSLPLSVLSAVPFGVFGALFATWLRGLANDVYFQVALVTLIGLSAKNAILIVEFAVEAWRGGKSLDEAALHASHLRFRPIVMTSLAFILGVVPLAVSTGAGANSRHAIGTAVAGGMLAATCIATLFIPFFFREIMKFSLFLRGKKDPHSQQKEKEEVKI